MERRDALKLLVLLAAGCGGSSDGETAGSVAAKPVLQVWKSPTCGCCGAWVSHVKAAGYPVEVVELADVTPLQRERGTPGDLAGCHTGLVGGYVIEGHVPAGTIDRLLAEKPAIKGLAVPGMPVGSPGMEVPGTPAVAYDVIAFTAQGERSVYASL